MPKQSPSLVLIAHADDAGSEAQIISDKLHALGYEVDRNQLGPGPRALRTLRQRLGKAERLILLWSKSAARTPELRAAANTAKARGALSIVRLDATPMPPGLGSHTINLRIGNLKPGRAQAFDWSMLMEATETDAVGTTTRLHALLATFLLALVTAVAAYQAFPDFAAQVDALRAQIENMVGSIGS